MKQLLITIAAVVLVRCGESQQSATAPEAEPIKPLAEAKNQNRRQQTSHLFKLPKQETLKPSNNTWRLVVM